MTLDHTADLLRLSIIQTDIRDVRTALVKAISAGGDRSFALLIKQKLTAAERWVKQTAEDLQRQAPGADDDSGVPEREALQL